MCTESFNLGNVMAFMVGLSLIVAFGIVFSALLRDMWKSLWRDG